MGKKKKKRIQTDGIMFSTDPDFDFDSVNGDEDEFESLKPSDQHLVIRKDKKHRKGKLVILIEGFEGSEIEMKLLAKELKGHCGTGGSAKDGEILIQGDFLQKINDYLIRSGYNVKKIG
jgi:translation initiation factor 1